MRESTHFRSSSIAAFAAAFSASLLLCISAHAQTSNPSEVAPLPEGWDQIDQRLVFLTVELSSAETSLNAINKAIVATGYQQAVKANKADQYQQGNEMMDRNGGGPIPWQDFYGKTASQFYYHPSSSLSATIHGGRVSDAQINATSNDGPLYAIPRPPQMDFIYRANADEKERAEADAAKLGQQIDKLLARRRELETEQSALWCKISFRAVSSQDVTDKPLYLFDPIATAGNGDQEKQQVAVIAAGRDFIRIVNMAIDQAQQNVDTDQGAVYTQLQQTVASARRDMDRQVMKQNWLAFDLQDAHTPLAQFTAATKRLEDSSENLVDEAKLISDSDAAGDEQRKSDFRGQLQQTLMDFASTTVTADQCLSDMAKQWKILPDPAHEAAELNLPVSNLSPSPQPIAPQPVVPPVATSPNATAFGNIYNNGKIGDTWTNSIGMTFAYIPAGEFNMGSPPTETGRSDDETLHHVKLTRPFLMAATFVTVAQFRTFVQDSGYQTYAEKAGWAYGWAGKKKGVSWQDPGYPQGDDHPVICAWNDANAFCGWLSQKESAHYRIPTEAQWEYACRAGTQTAFWWGNNPGDGVGCANCADQTAQPIFFRSDAFNWSDGYVYTSPVGKFRPNPWGLYDMAGDAWEWCADYYGNYTGDAVDPTGSDTGQGRVYRGGSWHWGTDEARCAFRGHMKGGDTFLHYLMGFRVVAGL